MIWLHPHPHPSSFSNLSLSFSDFLYLWGGAKSYTGNNSEFIYSRQRISQNSFPKLIHIFPKSFMIFQQELLDASVSLWTNIIPKGIIQQIWWLCRLHISCGEVVSITSTTSVWRGKNKPSFRRHYMYVNVWTMYRSVYIAVRWWEILPVRYVDCLTRLTVSDEVGGGGRGRGREKYMD